MGGGEFKKIKGGSLSFRKWELMSLRKLGLGVTQAPR